MRNQDLGNQKSEIRALETHVRNQDLGQDGRLHGEHGESVEDVPRFSHLCRLVVRGQHLRRPEATALLGI